MYMESCECGCDNGACIPQRQYDRPRTDPLSPEELQETIWFSVNGVCGYPLKDALRKQYTGLEGRDDKMFANSKSSISIRLEVCPPLSAQSNNGPESYLQWLPYEKWTRQVGAGTPISFGWRLITSVDSNVNLAERAGSHHPREAGNRGGEEDGCLLQGKVWRLASVAVY